LNGTQAVFDSMATVTSSMTITCPLPRDQFSRFSVNADFYAGNIKNFDALPPGGATMTYSVAISNDGKQFSAEKRLRILSTLCAWSVTRSARCALVVVSCISELLNPSYTV